MLKNYFKTTFRNMMRNKIFSFINILGLGLGIASSLLIYLWIQDEISYDSFHENGDRLYSIIVSDKNKDGSIAQSYESTPGLLAEALKKDIPEVEYAVTVLWDYSLLFSVGKEVGKETGRYVGKDFFNMFTYSFLSGDAKTALSSPDNIVITKKLAEKYFGRADPIGKIVRVGDKRDYIVTAVVNDVPDNSSIKFDYLMPIEHGFEDGHWMIDGWNHFGPLTYVTLHKNASIETVNAKLKDFLYKQDKILKDKMLSLQLFKDHYLYSTFSNGIAVGGRVDYVKMLVVVAIFILMIACINFMNLATARSVKRSKEIGVRKVMGAKKGVLFRQFLLEALFTTSLAVILAVGLVMLFLPLFNGITEKHLYLNLNNPSLITSIGAIALITGFIAGSYPALFMSSLNPINVLKGAVNFKMRDTIFRKGLVVFQFTLSIILIAFTVIVYKQMNFVQSKNLGLNHSNLLYVMVEGDLIGNFTNFKNEGLASGIIESISFSGPEPTNVGWYSPAMYWKGKDPNDRTLFAQVEVGYDFLKTMKIELIAGRDFSPSFADSSNFIVNETALRYMKIKEPLGASFSHGNTKGKIIGVVKDYHIKSLHDPIAPIFMNLAPGPEEGVAIIRPLPGKTKETITTIEGLFKKFNPKYPFSFHFVDERLNRHYQSEIVVGKLSNVFASIAIFISCMGLFGLSMFMAEQRTKEIGIRKVVGASVARIVALLSKDFMVLVILAFVIATPIAWWAINQWLQDFAFKTDVDWKVFAMAGFSALGIAILTIALRVIKAAMTNPVKSLRTE